MKKFKNELKGESPGIFLANELELNGFSQNRFALYVGIDRQILNSIILNKRRISIRIALLIENGLNLEEGFLLQLQLFYDIKKIKQRN